MSLATQPGRREALGDGIARRLDHSPVEVTDLPGRCRRQGGAGGAPPGAALRVAGHAAAYAASKAALVQLTRALALAWARHRIRVNAIARGHVETDLNRDFFASGPGSALIARIPSAGLASSRIWTARCCCSPRMHRPT